MEKIFNKKILGILILVLIVICVLFVMLYIDKSGQYNELNSEYSDVIKKCYLLEGNNGAWQFEDGKILLSENNQYVESGKIKYVGNLKDDLSKVDSYNIQIIAKIDGNEETLSSSAVSDFSGGGINMAIDKGITMASVYSSPSSGMKKLINNYQMPITCQLKITYKIDNKTYDNIVGLLVEEINLDRTIKK